MTNAPYLGQRTICELCGRAITWDGRAWRHEVGWQPRHLATPHEPATVTTSDGYIVKTSDERVLACVNACAGIADPSAIPDAIRDLQTLFKWAWEHLRKGEDGFMLERIEKTLAKLKGGA